MAKIKLTKNEQKAQRDALKRYQRYLPTLQLKKQQLQLEVRQVREAVDLIERDKKNYEHEISAWVSLFGDDLVAQATPFVEIEEWHSKNRNIAGIDTPVFDFVRFREVPRNLFSTPLYLDAAVQAVQKLITYELEVRTLREQLALIDQELRVVSQRVNLFEKVKIPEAKESIRKIQIYLGDQQTSAVGRAKIAKGKCAARDASVGVAS